MNLNLLCETKEFLLKFVWSFFRIRVSVSESRRFGSARLKSFLQNPGVIPEQVFIHIPTPHPTYLTCSLGFLISVPPRPPFRNNPSIPPPPRNNPSIPPLPHPKVMLYRPLCSVRYSSPLSLFLAFPEIQSLTLFFTDRRVESIQHTWPVISQAPLFVPLCPFRGYFKTNHCQ